MPPSDQSGAVIINGRAAKWLLGVLTTMVGFILVTALGTIFSYSQRLDVLERFQARTEANRFTDQDANALFGRMMDFHNDNTPPRDVELLLIQYDERLDRLEGN